MEEKIIYKQLVQVHVNDEYMDDTPDVAVIELTKSHVKRIQQLAAAVKKLKVTYIEEWDYPEALMCGEITHNKKVTDKTTKKQAALLINDDDAVTVLLAKNILAGNAPSSIETINDLQSTLTEWDGSSDCDMLKVSGDDFHYKGYIKHTSVSWETEGIPLKDLPRIK